MTRQYKVLVDGRSAVSQDRRWFAELSWTDAPENLGWFVHPFSPVGDYDNLTVTWTCEDAGQTAEDVLRAWEAFQS